MICVYIPRALAELYHAQGWEIFVMGHKLYSGHLLAVLQKVTPAP